MQGKAAATAADAPLRALEMWSLDFPVDSMTLLSVTAPHPQEVISSSMEVLGDDAIMIKYLNPHLVVVMTASIPDAGEPEPEPEPYP